MRARYLKIHTSFPVSSPQQNTGSETGNEVTIVLRKVPKVEDKMLAMCQKIIANT